MPSRRWSPWVAGLTLAMASCATPAQDLKHLLWPDQFHFTYETADGEVDGRSGTGRGLESEREALLFGLSWDISARDRGLSREDLRGLVLELRRDLEPAEQQAVGVSEAQAPARESAPPEPALVAETAPEPEPAPLAEPAPPPEELRREPEPVEEAPAPAEPAASASPEVAPAASEPAPPALQAASSTAPPLAGSAGPAASWILPLAALGVIVLALALRRLPHLRPARAGK